MAYAKEVQVAIMQALNRRPNLNLYTEYVTVFRFNFLSEIGKYISCFSHFPFVIVIWLNKRLTSFKEFSNEDFLNLFAYKYSGYNIFTWKLNRLILYSICITDKTYLNIELLNKFSLLRLSANLEVIVTILL